MFYNYYKQDDHKGLVADTLLSALTPLHMHLLLVITWIIFPILSIFPICILLYYARLTKPELLFYFLLLALVPGLVNYTKTPETDLAQYVYEFQELYALDFLRIRTLFPTDPVFYGTSWLLAHLSGGNTQLFPLFWSTFTYFVFFNAIYEFNKIFGDGKKKRMIGALFFAMFIGLDFSLSAHLVRQYPALSMLMYGLARYARNKKDNAIFFVMAFLTHFSTIIFLPILLLLKIPRRLLYIFLLLLFLLALQIGRENILNPDALEYVSGLPVLSVITPDNIMEKASIYIEKDDGSLTMRLYAEIAFYILIVLYVLIWGGKNYTKEGYQGVQKFGLVFIIFMIFLLFVRNNNLLMLRYFFYLHFLSAFVLLFLFRINNYVAYSFFLLYVISAPLRLIRAWDVNTFSYIDNSYDILFYNVFNFLFYKVI